MKQFHEILDPLRCRPMVQDLHQHAWLRIRRSNGSIAPWSFIDDGNKTVAAIESMGLAQVPDLITAGPTKAGKIVHVLNPFASMAPGGFL